MIFTDGKDNASVKHTSMSNKDLVAMAKRQGWNIIYLGGGGQDAERVGVERLGLDRGQCLTFNSSNRQATMAALDAASQQVLQYRSMGVGSAPSFTALHRGTSGAGLPNPAIRRAQSAALPPPPPPAGGGRGISGYQAPPPAGLRRAQSAVLQMMPIPVLRRAGGRGDSGWTPTVPPSSRVVQK